MHATTSNLRRALCAAICRASHEGTPEMKRAIGESLEVLPFERMSDAALLEMAGKHVPFDRLEKICSIHSAEHYEIRQTVLCPTCNDARNIEGPPGRWSRCPNCNPVRES